MSFGTAITTCLRKFATFRGRASRSEYWWFYLFWFLVMAAAIVIGAAINGARTAILFLLIALFGLALPQISAAVRRLHDTDLSGWWYLIVFVPTVGGLVLLILLCQRGTEGENRFGEDPLGDPSAVFA
jgi:uncharacterized membrane protein YhaH (DUF805 family)